MWVMEPLHPSFTRRVVVGAVALGLTAAGVVLASRSLRPNTSSSSEAPRSGSTDRVPYSLVGEPRIAAEISPPDDAVSGGVAVGAGSAWVGVQTEAGRGIPKVLRIDLETNEITAEIRVQETPWRRRIAATSDAVWVGASDVIERIDPATNKVVASVDIPGRSATAVAVGEESVWVTAVVDRSDQGQQNLGSLLRIDPMTNDIVADIPLESHVTGWEDQIVLGAGSVWVLGTRLTGLDTERGGDLIRIDGSTNRIVATVPVGGLHMVMGEDEVWVRYAEDGAFDEPDERWLWTRVDTETNQPGEPFEFDDRGLRLVASDALWSVDYDKQSHVRASRLDRETLEVTSQSEPIRGLFHDAVVDPASRSIWVSGTEGIVRIDVVGDEEGSPSARCPPHEGAYVPIVAPSAGPPGSSASVSGPIPHDGGKGGGPARPTTEITAWWNLDMSEWWSALTHPDEPTAARQGPTVYLGQDDVREECDYRVEFTVPDVPAGTYDIVVLNGGPDVGGPSHSALGAVPFRVTAGS